MPSGSAPARARPLHSADVGRHHCASHTMSQGRLLDAGTMKPPTEASEGEGRMLKRQREKNGGVASAAAAATVMSTPVELSSTMKLPTMTGQHSDARLSATEVGQRSPSLHDEGEGTWARIEKIAV